MPPVPTKTLTGGTLNKTEAKARYALSDKDLDPVRYTPRRNRRGGAPIRLYQIPEVRFEAPFSNFVSSISRSMSQHFGTFGGPVEFRRFP